ncbi:MAG TPA: peptidoglycan-binding protein [Blastocatellia bacterium]|nr:peptidoglycan-binding protein [Blastocatellia bacterium]
MEITELIPIPNGINQGVSPAHQHTMLALLGSPRGSFAADCQEVTNPTLARLIVTEDLGPFRVHGLRPAVETLQAIFADIKRENPEVFAALGTAGMLCARFVRGSQTSISNHSWGTAIDLKLKGQLDARGNGKVQAGLAAIAPIFNRHGYFWGAGFPTEDGMHFEASDEKIREWHAAGIFGDHLAEPPEPTLSLGDRGPAVKALQQALNAKGANLEVDGDFGRGTLAAVMDFQARNGLSVDGTVGPRTLRALGL